VGAVTVVVRKEVMVVNRTLLNKIISVGVDVLGFFIVKKNLIRYKETATHVMDAGRDTGITVIAVVDALRDHKLRAEEDLDLAEKLSTNKRSLDKALTTLIKDLKDHAIEKTGGGNKNA